MTTKDRNALTLPHSYDRAALARFELFLFAGIATVLITRAYLAATGYPQIGGGALHIAHVLWGGLLMAVAIVATAITEGSRTRDLATLVGGIGFGLFIDEVGKFVTADVDYFYQPAIAIMYVVFVLFYLAAREVVIRRGMNDRHRLAIGARALSDLALGQLDEIQYNHALRVLDGVEDRSLTDLVRFDQSRPAFTDSADRRYRIEDHSWPQRVLPPCRGTAPAPGRPPTGTDPCSYCRLFWRLSR